MTPNQFHQERLDSITQSDCDSEMVDDALHATWDVADSIHTGLHEETVAVGEVLIELVDNGYTPPDAARALQMAVVMGKLFVPAEHRVAPTNGRRDM